MEPSLRYTWDVPAISSHSPATLMHSITKTGKWSRHCLPGINQYFLDTLSHFTRSTAGYYKVCEPAQKTRTYWIKRDQMGERHFFPEYNNEMKPG